MSYASATALQKAVFTTLTANAAVTALVGTAIYDAVPAGAVPPLYVSLGTEDVRVRGDTGGGVARYRVIIRVVSEAAGFGEAKQAAGAIADALTASPPTLDLGHLIALRLDRVQANRTIRNSKRQVELRFEALVDASTL